MTSVQKMLDVFCREIEARLVAFDAETGVALTHITVEWIDATRIEDDRRKGLPIVTASAVIASSFTPR